MSEPLDAAATDAPGEFGPAPIVPDSRFPQDAQYALEARGDAADLLVPSGGYLHCVDIERGGLQPRIGDPVIVRLVRGDVIETAACRLTHEGLQPLTSNPSRGAFIPRTALTHIRNDFLGLPEARIQAVIIAGLARYI